MMTGNLMNKNNFAEKTQTTALKRHCLIYYDTIYGTTYKMSANRVMEIIC